MGKNKKAGSAALRSKSAVVRFESGAFTWTASSGRVCLRTLSDSFYFRVSTATAAGKFLSMAVEAARKGDTGAGKFLSAYASVFMEAHSVVPCCDKAEGESPEFDFLSELHRASLEAVRRHPDIYGGRKGPVTDEEDKKVLGEERRLREAEDSLKKDSSEDSLKS